MPQEETASLDSPAAVPASSGDARLVQQLRQGDIDAGRRFVHAHYPGIYRYLLYLTGCPHAAEDLTQETFLQAWRSLASFDESASLRPWLHRIAHREFLQTLRRQRRAPAEQRTASLEEIAEPPAPGAPAWMDMVELRALIGRLPVEERELVILHYLEGYEYQEIARILGVTVGRVRHRLSDARCHLQQELGEGDLAYLNEAAVPMRQWAWLPLDQMHALEMRLTRWPTGGHEAAGTEAAMEEDMERREFLRQAVVGTAGLMLSETEKEVVDPRLTQKVTCAFKGTALSDLCEKLRVDTGIHLVAGSSVADEKVTLFCEKLPLREVMRQLSRPFGYTWVRSRKEGGEYRYELMQDLRSQLLEEELRNRDRNASLLALEREIDRYRPYLHLSPDEAHERARTAPEGERPLLQALSRQGWGVIQLYFRLSPQELATLRTGESLRFSTAPKPGERLLPPDLRLPVLQSQRQFLALRGDDGALYSVTTNPNRAGALPLASLPEVGARVTVTLAQSELGEFQLRGRSGHFFPRDPESGVGHALDTGGGVLALGRSPTVPLTRGRKGEPRGIVDPTLRRQVTLQPEPTCRVPVTIPGTGEEARSEPRVTTADVLEALHRATGMPIVSDHYTRLYRPQEVSLRNLPLADALDQLAEAMRVRWKREAGGGADRRGAGPRGETGGWLQFRSATYYHDRIKEVPNRLLDHWAARRSQQGALSLDDLVEIAQLTHAQLNGVEMAEGAEAIWGLAEWRLVRSRHLRPQIRFLAEFMPDQRRQMMSAVGLPFAAMTLSQQQGFLSRTLNIHPDDNRPLRSLDELEGAALRVEYTQPGAFQWRRPDEIGTAQWIRVLEPGPNGRRALMPPVRERTREAALRAVRRILPDAEPAQVFPTELNLMILFFPGISNRRPLRLVGPQMDLTPRGGA